LLAISRAYNEKHAMRESNESRPEAQHFKQPNCFVSVWTRMVRTYAWAARPCNLAGPGPGKRHPPGLPFCRLNLLFFFIVYKVLRRTQDPVAGIGSIMPSADLHAFAFQVFVDGKEVRNLLEHVRIDL
jgi:hypothetical protein